MLDLSTPMGRAIHKAKGLESDLFEHIRALTVAGSRETRGRHLKDCAITIDAFRKLNETSFGNNYTSQLRLTDLEQALASLATADLAFEATANDNQCKLCGEGLAGLPTTSAAPFCHSCFDRIMPAIESFQPGFSLDYD